MTEKGGQVLPLLGAPPEGDLDQPLDRVFFALSDPIRRSILNELDKGPRLVSELAAPFDISLQAVSRHIQVLVRAGLVQQERTGRISRCRLEVGPIFQASLWINRYSKYWQAQFDTLAAWLDHISEKKEGADAVPRSQRRTGGVSPRHRRAARKNTGIAKRSRTRRS